MHYKKLLTVRDSRCQELCSFSSIYYLLLDALSTFLILC